MIARVTTAQMAPGRLEEGIAQVRQVRDAMRQTDGCRDVYMLIDRKTGKGMALSLWESEEKLRAAETTLNQRRDEIVRTSGSVAPPTTDVFEVID